MSALMQQHEQWQGARARLGVAPPPAPSVVLERTMIGRLRAALEERTHKVAALEAKVAGLEDVNDKLTKALAKEMLRARKVVPPSVKAALSKETTAVKDRWTMIVSEVAEKHGVTLTDLRSKRRDKKTYVARHECFYRLKRETTLSIARIGHLMGHKDHTTVIHGIHRHEARIASGEAQ